MPGGASPNRITPRTAAEHYAEAMEHPDPAVAERERDIKRRAKAHARRRLPLFVLTFVPLVINVMFVSYFVRHRTWDYAVAGAISLCCICVLHVHLNYRKHKL